MGIINEGTRLRKADWLVFIVAVLLFVVLSELRLLHYVMVYILLFFLIVYQTGRIVGYYYGRKEKFEESKVAETESEVERN